jgi:hypothetical protein
MILLALLALAAQDAPAAATPSVEAENEIVVRAVYGRTTMLFDKGSDGKLRNCRIMISSGSQKRDTAACQATPICYFKTADEVTDCVPFSAVGPDALGAAPPPRTPIPVTGSAPGAFQLPLLSLPKPPPPAIGPISGTSESRESERQRVKLPELPKPDNGPPAITLSGPQPDPQTSRSPFDKSPF